MQGNDEDILPGLDGTNIPLPPIGGAAPPSSPGPGGSLPEQAPHMPAIQRNLELIATKLANLDGTLHHLRQDVGRLAGNGSGGSGDQKLEDLVRRLETIRVAFSLESVQAPANIATSVTVVRDEIKDLVQLLGDRANELMVGSLQPAAPQGSRSTGRRLMLVLSYLVIGSLAAAGGAAYWHLNNPPRTVVASNPFVDAGNNPRWLLDCPRDRRVAGARCAMNMATSDASK